MAKQRKWHRMSARVRVSRETTVSCGVSGRLGVGRRSQWKARDRYEVELRPRVGGHAGADQGPSRGGAVFAEVWNRSGSAHHIGANLHISSQDPPRPPRLRVTIAQRPTCASPPPRDH